MMETDQTKIIADNQKTWDAVSDLFRDASALPFWGPFGIGEDLDLIPEIKGRTFLEIGCGSGRSIRYLLENGARKAYGLDLSEKQLEEARRFNAHEEKKEKAIFIQGAMEERIDIEPADVVFSIYGIGWTVAPEKTFANIHSYLRPGGRFVWSWDHTFFIDVSYEDGRYWIDNPYHEEMLFTFPNWKGRSEAPHITYRKTSTWFRLLREAGFDIIGYYEPESKSLYRAHQEPEKYYSIQKAKMVPCSFIFVCQK